MPPPRNDKRSPDSGPDLCAPSKRINHEPRVAFSSLSLHDVERISACLEFESRGVKTDKAIESGRWTGRTPPFESVTETRNSMIASLPDSARTARS